MDNLKKPEPWSYVAYDYNECRDYIEEKYKINLRDYAGKWEYSSKKMDHIYLDTFGYHPNQEKPIKIQQKAFQIYKKEFEKDEPPYQDFWHWMIGNHDIARGSIIETDFEFEISRDDQYAPDPWVKEILKLFITEFGGKLRFWMDW